ncbi:MAG: hypothetical protein DME00_01420 [Candidatus Rokuibacteriota bacterium]|nr:MAG: hypothetical protein DME00_01420 [Candidatus Rokubacteria bacterium]PYO15290.1 MAG: hypothetical protein DMD75_03155 [Candidatus Rokubacteria bacterium]
MSDSLNRSRAARTLGSNGHFCRASNPQASHELVERAFATTITSQPDAPQDFGPREVRILA